MNGWLKGTPRTQSDRRLTSADEGKYDHGYLQEQHDHQDRHQKGPGQENGTEACCEESRNQGRRTPCGYDARACHPREIDHGTVLQIHDSTWTESDVRRQRSRRHGVDRSTTGRVVVGELAETEPVPPKPNHWGATGL